MKDRYHSCARKISYPDWETADLQRNKLLNRRTDDRPLTVYRCEYCGKYHVGHEDTSVADNKRMNAYRKELERANRLSKAERIEHNKARMKAALKLLGWKNE